MGLGGVWAMGQMAIQVRQVSKGFLDNRFLMLIRLRKTEACRLLVEMGHTNLQGTRSLGRNVQPQTLHQRAAGFAFTTALQPKQAKSERGIHRRLRLLRVYSQNSKRVLSLARQAPRIYGRKTPL